MKRLRLALYFGVVMVFFTAMVTIVLAITERITETILVLCLFIVFIVISGWLVKKVSLLERSI